jgi:hypothetical protein
MFYNSDTYPTAPIGSENLIAEMYFRIEVDQISHNREVYNFMMFIGDLGGVSELLLQICGWILGGYAAFHSAYSTMSALYFVQNNGEPIFEKSKQNNKRTPEIQKMKLPLKTRVFLYLLTTKASFFLSPCKHPIHQKYLDIIET